MVENTIFYNDSKEILQKLKKSGYTIGIITTKYHYRIEQILSKYDALNLVDLIVGADDVKEEKPNPEGLLWAIHSLHLKREDILYVGDSLVDSKTAENAQVSFAGVLTGTTTTDKFKLYKNVFIGKNIKDIYCFITGPNGVK